MIYCILTVCLTDADFIIRQKEYEQGITSLLQSVKSLPNVKVVIVENRGSRKTFLDTFGVPVLYTQSDRMGTNNKGIKELTDVLECIRNYNIQDDDFIVKMTGRYILEPNSPFIQHLTQMTTNDNYSGIQCMIRYGSYLQSVQPPMDDCITGLIGMKCKYVKTIQMPSGNECVEWKWAKKSREIAAMNISNVRALPKLGIRICPASHAYFLV